jgi:hypothetical protein
MQFGRSAVMAGQEYVEQNVRVKPRIFSRLMIFIHRGNKNNKEALANWVLHVERIYILYILITRDLRLFFFFFYLSHFFLSHPVQNSSTDGSTALPSSPISTSATHMWSTNSSCSSSPGATR